MNMYDWTQDVGPGWKQLVQGLIDLCDKEGALIGQVKEKFGGLRFYIDEGGTPELFKAIDEAEEKSYRICEVCGKEGKPRGGGWIKTLCDVHHAEREEKRKQYERAR